MHEITRGCVHTCDAGAASQNSSLLPGVFPTWYLPTVGCHVFLHSLNLLTFSPFVGWKQLFGIKWIPAPHVLLYGTKNTLTSTMFNHKSPTCASPAHQLRGFIPVPWSFVDLSPSLQTPRTEQPLKWKSILSGNRFRVFFLHFSISGSSNMYQHSVAVQEEHNESSRGDLNKIFKGSSREELLG